MFKLIKFLILGILKITILLIVSGPTFIYAIGKNDPDIIDKLYDLISNIGIKKYPHKEDKS